MIKKYFTWYLMGLGWDQALNFEIRMSMPTFECYSIQCQVEGLWSFHSMWRLTEEEFQLLSPSFGFTKSSGEII